MKIRRSKDALTADFNGSKVVFDIEACKPHILNHTAGRIWDFLKRPKDINQIACFLKKSYNLDRVKARRDAQAFIKELKKRGLVCQKKQE